MSSSSESEDEELLKEALAPGFTMEAVKKQSRMDKPAAVTKSLRMTDYNPEEHLSFQGVCITPQQRKFIANKLEEYLDKQVKESDLLSKAWEGKVLKTDSKKGIRLMAASKKRIKVRDAEAEEELKQISMKPHKQKKRKIEGNEDNLSTMEKVQAAAVSPEWVLEGKGVFGKGCTRGEVITGAVHSWAQNKKKQ